MGSGEKQPIAERAAGAPKLLAVAIAAALSGTVPLTADAAGLGRLTVQSALGQPLQAEVEVTALGREELGSLTARLAPPEAFRQAGLEYNPALTSLRFNIEQRPNGGAIVRVTSSQPVNEPFVDLLVELNWSSGKFVREYTFLLDPPELRMGRDTTVAGGQGAPIVAPAVRTPASQPAVASAAAPAAAARTASAATPAASTPVAPAVTSGADAPASVVVQSGDTLAKIAGRVKPADIALEQAVMAIYEANPRAFFGTVHQMLAGAELRIPDHGTMAAVDAAAAKREIRAQAADFNAYRARLAASARSVEPTRAGQSVKGSVGGKVDDAAAPAASGDQLKLSRSGAAAGDAAGSATGSADAAEAAAVEERVAREAALREQQERVAALERNVADLQQLVELKNQQLADLQRQVESARAAGATASGTIGATAPSALAAPAAGPDAAGASPAAGSASSDSGAAVTAAATQPPASAPTSSADSASAPAPVSADASSAAAPASTDATPPAAGDSSSVSTPPVSADASSVPAPAAATADAGAPSTDSAASAPPAASPPAAAPQAPAPSVLESLMDNPAVLPAFVAIALGLGAFGLYAVRRRKKGAEFEDSLTSADAFTANSLFGSTGGQSVDTHSSLFATSGRDSGVDVHSTEVDPIAEAEVYIAYGREAQAEEILKEALKRQPERQAIRLKLLEIHAARKDPVAFGVLAQEMYDQASGQNEEWPKVVTLGLAIDPANPLYTGQGDASFARSDAPAGDAAPHAAYGAPVADAGLPAIADLGSEAGAAAAMFGESASDPASAARRAFRPSFAETVPMDGADASAAQAPDDDDVPALDFDLDLGTTVGRAGGALGARDDSGAPASGSALENAVDGRFELPSLDLDLRSAGQAAAGTHAEADFAIGEPAGDEVPALADLGDFQIDLPSLESLDAERPAVDLADVEGNGGLGNLDLGSIDLDLSSGSDVGLAAAETAIAPQVESSRWQEMATKLDLASAYEEIGDKEGARELLQEVLDGGDAAQQQKARSMLAKIGGTGH